VADLLETENDAPIIKLINALLTQAVREGASDVHLEIFESRALVRFRVDGSLRDVVEPRRGLHPAMVSRIKVMASLDIAEKRLPQDGRIALRIAGRAIDVRVSTNPTNSGERVVLRLLDKQAGRLTLDALGMGPGTRDAIDALIQSPHGIFLVTGPTGSGKTTTLYSALSRLDRKTRNILTVEDPVEYELDGVGQTQVNPRIEMTFARALRAILRQDPDVVMIGEIRDLETAQIAVQASLTGHLVLATLHTNDAPGAVTRLIDMGIEPYLLASTLNGVLAQRLVRKLCAQCKAPYEPDAAERAVFGASAPERLYKAVGCGACNFSGYRGRTGIYELLTANDDLRHRIHDTAEESTLRELAVRNGMVRLREDGLRWVREGVTSLDEVLRVTRT
jgi:general secretion pathway protein E